MRLTARATRPRAAILGAVLCAALACVPEPPPPDAGPMFPGEPALFVASGAPAPDEADAPPAITPSLPDAIAGEVTLHDAGLVAMPGGRSPEVLLDLPEGVESVVLLASAHRGVHVILERAEGPGGELLVTDEEPAELSDEERAVTRGFPAQFFSKNRVVAGRELAAFLLPNTPDVTFGPGRFRLRFGTWLLSREGGELTKTAVERPLRLGLLVKRKAQPRRPRGTLNVTLHLTGAAGISADSASENGDLQASLEVLREALAAIGIALAPVSYVDVSDPGFRTIVLDDGCEGGDLDELMKLSSQGRAGVHLFLIERFQCLVSGGVDVGQGIGGLTAAVPGPPWLRGSPRSGVAVATAPFEGDPDKLGLVLAHELGHFLGLYHTKENDLFGGPEIFDAISDTPDDERAEDNLMYFLADHSTALSDGQASVLRASAWVLP